VTARATCSAAHWPPARSHLSTLVVVSDLEFAPGTMALRMKRAAAAGRPSTASRTTVTAVNARFSFGGKTTAAKKSAPYVCVDCGCVVSIMVHTHSPRPRPHPLHAPHVWHQTVHHSHSSRTCGASGRGSGFSPASDASQSLGSGWISSASGRYRAREWGSSLTRSCNCMRSLVSAGQVGPLAAHKSVSYRGTLRIPRGICAQHVALKVLCVICSAARPMG
jgi:hypothetical protein